MIMRATNFPSVALSHAHVLLAISAFVLSAHVGYAQNGISCPPEQRDVFFGTDCCDCLKSFYFGRSIAIDNVWMAIGQQSDSGGDVLIYRFDDSGNWIIETELTANVLEGESSLGMSLAFHSDLLAVGNPALSTTINNGGAVYLYQRDNMDQWSQIAQIEPAVPEEYKYFGNDVTWLTSNGDVLLVVGASHHESDDGVGAVYFFRQLGNGSWQQVGRMTEPGFARDNDFFGHSLDSVEGNGESILVVGARRSEIVPGNAAGKVYFYRFDSATDDLILEADFTAPNPFDYDFFGDDVAVGVVTDIPDVTHRAVVSRSNERNAGGLWVGGAYTYYRTVDGTWHLESHLRPPIHPINKCSFGSSLDLSRPDSKHLLIGSETDNEFGSQAGSAFLFDFDSTTRTWNPTQGLYAQGENSLDNFGAAVALGNGVSDGLAAIGAPAAQCPGEDEELFVGAAYSFDLDPTDGGTLPCPPPLLKIIGGPDCARNRAADMEVRWFNASPGSNTKVALLLSRALGSQVIPPSYACAGTQLGLANNHLQIAYTGPAGTFGATSLKSRVPASICNTYLQLLDISSCQTSNVVQIQ